MKEIKKTITREEITGYEAFDGTWFRSKDGCEEYESTAKAAAKKTAWNYLIRTKSCDICSLFDLCYDDDVAVFDVRDVDALEILNHWLVMERSTTLDVSVIGKKVAIAISYCDGYEPFYLGTEEKVLEDFTNMIRKLFADKEKPKAE